MKRNGMYAGRILGLAVLTALFAVGCGSQEQEHTTGQAAETENHEPNGGAGGAAGEEHSAGTEAEGPRGEEAQGDGISFTSCGMTISLPADWRERYLIVEDAGGFSVYQKASYEKTEGMGYLFGLSRGTEYWNYGAGETLLAYTEGGTLYYLLQPTDFPCDTEDKALCDEYQEMSKDVEGIVDSVSIEEEAYLDAEEYVIPVSSILPLSEDVLLNYSGNELWIAKNEIYARHGRKFQNEFLQGYFDSCSWYEGTAEPEQFSESVLSELEQENVKRIAARAEVLAEENPYPKEYKTGETVKADLTGDGVTNTVSYQVKDEGNDAYSYRLTIDGVTFELGETIVMCTPVTDVFYITDITTYEAGLEIAVLDEGPSGDPETHFFRYDGEAPVYLGAVSGFPFPEQNFGRNGFDGTGGIVGRGRVDLIETAYTEDYWRYDFEAGKIEEDSGRFYNFYYYIPHELYVDLPVHRRMDASSETDLIPAGQKVYFLSTDGEAWIYVKGKDGTAGYMQVRQEQVAEVAKPAAEVFSGLDYFD